MSEESLGMRDDGVDSRGQDGKRPWTPNRVRKVKSKKDLDQSKMDHFVSQKATAYKGELDPRKKDPLKGSKPRSISRSERKVMDKARALAADDPKSQDSPRPAAPTDFRDAFSSCKASPGRLGALYATNQVRRRGAYAQEVIESTIDRSKLSPEDKAFATLLTLGVVSTSGCLDALIDRCLDSPTDIKRDVRDALRLSTYEIIYLRKAPHAALDQGVELVRAVAPSAAGLGNAVLHRVLNLADTFPFADPAVDIEALALLYGFPLWLAKLLVKDMGGEAAIALMRASNEPAPVFLGVNSIRSTDEEVLSLFREAGVELLESSAGGITPPGCYRVPEPRILSDGRIRRLFSQGRILISDASAQAVASCVVGEQSPRDLLEIGAGRGTKTILMQSDAQRRFEEQLDLTPLDNHGFKTDLLRERAKTYGVELSDPLTGNATRLTSVLGERTFDRIFIDAPCSGLGTLRRHHEIRWRITPEQIEDLASMDLALLRSAANHVSLGGDLFYSTCTVTYAENNGTVKRFLESPEGEGFSLAPIAGRSCFASELSPGSPDAHFAVRFQRNS